MTYVSSSNIKITILIDFSLLIFICIKSKFWKYIANIIFLLILLINTIVFKIAKALLTVGIIKTS